MKLIGLSIINALRLVLLGDAEEEDVNVAVAASFAAWTKGELLLQRSIREPAQRLRRSSIIHLVRLRPFAPLLSS